MYIHWHRPENRGKELVQIGDRSCMKIVSVALEVFTSPPPAISTIRHSHIPTGYISTKRKGDLTPFCSHDDVCMCLVVQLPCAFLVF